MRAAPSEEGISSARDGRERRKGVERARGRKEERKEESRRALGGKEDVKTGPGRRREEGYLKMKKQEGGGNQRQGERERMGVSGVLMN